MEEDIKMIYWIQAVFILMNSVSGLCENLISITKTGGLYSKPSIFRIATQNELRYTNSAEAFRERNWRMKAYCRVIWMFKKVNYIKKKKKKKVGF